MAVDCTIEVHQNDVGTTYQVRVFDDCVPFDPSDASVSLIIFKMPGGVILTKAATVVPEGSPAESWLLVYQVQADDGAGSPPDAFHERTGAFRMQAYLEWTDGSHYHSNIVTHDADGRELRIHKNLL